MASRKAQAESEGNNFICVHCSEPCGDNARVQPWFTKDDSGDGAGKDEVWCAPCWAWVRAPRDDTRFSTLDRSPWLIPVRCDRCGWVSVAHGKPTCRMCGWPVVNPVQPKDPNQHGHISIVAPLPPGVGVGGLG